MLILAFLLTILLTHCDIRIQEALPLLNTTVKTKDPVFLQVTQNQIARHWLSPQSKIVSSLPEECHIHPAEISVSPIAQLSIQPVSMQKMYSFNRNEGALYQLTDNVITKYQISWLQGKLSLINSLNFSGGCGKDMVEQWQQEFLYIFACDRIYKLNGNLSTVGQIKRKEGNFSSFKVLRFQQYIFEVSSNEGVNIYRIDFGTQIEFVGNINKYKDHTLHIADLFFYNNTLYILDYKQGIFLYQPNKSHPNFTQTNKIQLSFKQSVDYKLLLLHKNNLFVALSKVGQTAVAQYSLINHKAYLIRYFKGYSTIDQISIYQNKLLIEGQSKIELLPINRDPRTIGRLNNGYAYTHDIQIQELNYLQDSKFLISSHGLLQIVGWNIKESILECFFADIGTYSIKYEEPCQVSLTNNFFQVCEFNQQISISVTSSHKDNYFWLFLIVTGIFIFGVIFLIFWRHDQTQKINKLIRRIKQYKQKFQPKKQTIQFEQVDHAYSIDLKTQSEGFKESLQHKQLHEEEINQQSQSQNHEDLPESERRSISHT